MWGVGVIESLTDVPSLWAAWVSGASSSDAIEKKRKTVQVWQTISTDECMIGNCVCLQQNQSYCERIFFLSLFLVEGRVHYTDVTS